jgi:hypothetical protein
MVPCVPAPGRRGSFIQNWPRARGVVTVALLALSSAGVVSAQTPSVAQAPAAAPQPPAAAAQLREELQRLRQEFESIRDAYGARLAALESRLAQQTGEPATAPAAAAAAGAAPSAGSQAGAAPAAAPSAAAVPAAAPVAAAAGEAGQAQAPETAVPTGAAGAGGPAGTLPVYGNASAMSKVFNPDIAVIGNFVGAAGSNAIEPRPAMQLDEAEVSLQAVVDPYARADFFLSASPEGLEVEEGFLTFPTLPGGLLMKVGKMKAQFGKANTMHSHVLPWVDQALVVRNLLGGDEGLNDSGISISRLIPNAIMFLEATGEIYQGQNDLFSSHTRGDLGYVARLRGYRDVTEGTNLDLGTSFAYGHNAAGEDTTTRVIGVDATVRYRPLRRAIYRRFIGRTELMWSRQGEAAGDVQAFGMYGSAEYQFARRWFAGARYDWSERAYDSSMTDKGPSLLVTYWPSEFSQIRTQYRRTQYAEGSTSNELLFQFLFSIGAHGAHVF